MIVVTEEVGMCFTEGQFVFARVGQVPASSFISSLSPTPAVRHEQSSSRLLL